MNKPIMARATAVWLVDNTTLTFNQIADFCGMHELEVQGIADGDVGGGVKGFDPVANNQLDPIEIDRGQADPLYKLKLKYNAAAVGEEKRRGPRYTPLSQAAGPPGGDLLAGQVPPRTVGWRHRQAGRHHEADDPVDPRSQPLEHLEHPADRPGCAGPVQAVRTGRRRSGRRAQEIDRWRRDER